MRWVDRSGLAKMVSPASARGMLFTGSPAEYTLGLSEAELDAMCALTRNTLENVGIGRSDKLLMALRHEGSPSVELLARAAGSVAGRVGMTGPAGRLRLLATIRTTKPNVLVITPCGAADLLARLYLEFNVDPVELELERIILVGEIASRGLRKRLAKEFEAEIAELYCDPVFGAALAGRADGDWEVAADTALGLAPLADDVLATGIDGEGELVLRPIWSQTFGDLAIRTGQVIAGTGGDAGLFNRTVGEHVLARGQFLSLPLLRKQLALIDGAASWTLSIERGDRTLDDLTLTVGLDRETLVANPMWLGRIQQAIAAVTPVKVAVRTCLADPDPSDTSEMIDDRRGHHLGVDRKTAVLA